MPPNSKPAHANALRPLPAGSVVVNKRGRVPARKRKPAVRAPKPHEIRAEAYAKVRRYRFDWEMEPEVCERGWGITLSGLRLVSEMNAREHWAARNSRKQSQQRAVYRAITGMRSPTIPECPVVVTITRMGPRKFDSDNLAASAKAVRDEIARALGCDDGDEAKVEWRYEQGKGVYAVHIDVHPMW